MEGTILNYRNFITFSEINRGNVNGPIEVASIKPRIGKIYLNHSNKVSGEILSNSTNCVIDDFEYRPTSRRKLETFVSKRFDPLYCSDVRDCHDNLKTINESKIERMHRRQLRAILGKN